MISTFVDGRQLRLRLLLAARAGRRDRAGGQAHRHPLRRRHRPRRAPAARPRRRPRRPGRDAPALLRRPPRQAVDGPLNRLVEIHAEAEPDAGAGPVRQRGALRADGARSEREAARLADPARGVHWRIESDERTQPLRRAHGVPAARRLDGAPARAPDSVTGRRAPFTDHHVSPPRRDPQSATPAASTPTRPSPAPTASTSGRRPTARSMAPSSSCGPTSAPTTSRARGLAGHAGRPRAPAPGARRLLRPQPGARRPAPRPTDADRRRGRAGAHPRRPRRPPPQRGRRRAAERPHAAATLEHLHLEARMGGYEAANAAPAGSTASTTLAAGLIGAAPGRDRARRERDGRLAAGGRRAAPGRGDRVLVSRSGYVSCALQLLALERDRGIVVELLPNGDGRRAGPRGAARGAGPRPAALLALTHIPTSSGLVEPVAEVGRLARAAGVTYLLDATQSVGPPAGRRARDRLRHARHDRAASTCAARAAPAPLRAPRAAGAARAARARRARRDLDRRPRLELDATAPPLRDLGGLARPAPRPRRRARREPTRSGSTRSPRTSSRGARGCARARGDPGHRARRPACRTSARSSPSSSTAPSPRRRRLARRARA